MVVGLKYPENILPVSGVEIGVTSARLRRSGRNDLTIFQFPDGANVAGVFTRNKARAAPVTVAEEHLASSEKIGALVINSGIANAGLGEEGIKDCLAICESLASLLNISVESVLPFSTGVIGTRLPVGQIQESLPECINNLSAGNWVKSAEAIMTTDTIPKAISRVVDFEGSAITISGIAKGAGMIHPNMATMLSFIATDASIDRESLSRALIRAVNLGFNRITVEGDTSTNDACVIAATGASGVEISPSSREEWDKFCNELNEIVEELAKMIVRDAEGCSKFVSIEVVGGWREGDCLKVGRNIANSPLVKTAIYASDPNWGRIFGAVGRTSVEELDISLVNISINGVEVVSGGAVSEKYTEQAGAEAMSSEEIHILVDLGLGDSSATVWTCDMSMEYVKINAEYRT